jgi:hypothetical protein
MSTLLIGRTLWAGLDESPPTTAFTNTEVYAVIDSLGTSARC